MKFHECCSARARRELPAILTGIVLASLVVVAAMDSPARAGSLTRTTAVPASADAVWSVIGPFCAIKDWHPVIGTCVLDGKTPPTRTLVSKDGKVAFVETEMARDDARHLYSYDFVASPLPATHYLGTIKVEPDGANGSRVVWHGSYVASKGQDKAVENALAGIYESGLAAIKARFTK
ncbi:MAG TPA: SRPBCC family protein [Rhizomicrobium sp.]|nr:SRPBCC family protein [Rhizomicrobium sp.]